MKKRTNKCIVVFIVVLFLTAMSNIASAENRITKDALRSGDVLIVEPREFEGIVGDHVYLTYKIDPSFLDEWGNMPEGTQFVWSWSCSFLDWDDINLPDEASFGFTARRTGQGSLQVKIVDASIHTDGTGPVLYSDYCAVTIKSSEDGGSSGGCHVGLSIFLLSVPVMFRRRYKKGN